MITLEIIIILLAGLGAGIVTGLVGASAVMVAAPLLIIFLGYSPYIAIGLSLSIDVFASLSATIIYKKNKKIKIKPSLILLSSALIAVIFSSGLSFNFNPILLGIATGIGIIISGFFIIKKRKENLNFKTKLIKKYRTFFLILTGLLIGFIAGAFGAGGGIMILLALILILDYKTHEAIGTSVFLMIFIASFGGISHYIYSPFSITILLIAGVGGIIGAIFSSVLANKLSENILRKIVGIIIIILGILLFIKNII